MKKVFFYSLMLLLLFTGIGSDALAQNAATLNPPSADRMRVTTKNILLSWKQTGHTNKDTSIAFLTGAAQAYDTTDAPYYINGANTLVLQSIWSAPAGSDSCLGIIRMDVSNDAVNWTPYPNAGIPNGVGVDSSEWVSSTGSTLNVGSALPRLKSITGFSPGMCVRFRFEKYLSASTDTLKLKARLVIISNDE